MEQKLTSIIEDSFIQFSGAVLQSRALVDVRDCVKPSARQIFYCLYTDKFIHNKPYKKTLKAIGSAFRLYIHGDSSAEGVIMRAAQPFAMRYPLIEVEGSYGTLLASGSWSAPRYTSSRLTSLSEYLFEDIKKETIDEWRDNYDNTEQYPMVLPSKGFFNLVNGSYGIGVGASSSIPQYNLRELNNALIKVLWDPDIDFDEIYCAPDFATGAILLNEKEVKESHRTGQGFACKLRSIIEWDSKDRCFIVKEIPYMLYTETICRELEDIINGEDNPGIDRFNDLTGETPLIKIYLSKKGNPDKILKFLYKNTSLQSHYGINFTMLEQGRYPKVFGWKEILNAHIDHEIVIYTKGYEFDIKKIEARLHIIEGLLKAISQIDQVVGIIKKASSTNEASQKLQDFLYIDEIQAKAILDIKLSRLARMEVNKLENEKSDLEVKANKINEILNNEDLLKKEIEKGLREVSDKFGDARRTKILNLSEKEDEVQEEFSISINLTNHNNVYLMKESSLCTQRRGGVGQKFKMKDDEYIISTCSGKNSDTILFFSNKGYYYHYSLNDLPIDELISLSNFFNLDESEEIKELVTYNKKSQGNNIIFLTKNGILKKSELSTYNISKKIGMKAIQLSEDDEIVSVMIMDDEPIGILTKDGQFVFTRTDDIRCIGRVSKGIKGIKLNDGDYVVAARPVYEVTRELLTITQEGMVKRTKLSDFSLIGHNTKGSKIHKLTNNEDKLIDFLPIYNDKEVLVVANSSQIKLPISDISLTSKNTLGNKGIKIAKNKKVIGLSKF